jgi:hypothetical protein
MPQQPPPGKVFAVWFQSRDLNQRLLAEDVNRYGSVQLQMKAVSTDALGNSVTARRSVSVLPTLKVVDCANPNRDTSSPRVKPSSCIFHQANTGYYGYTMDLLVGLHWNGWGSPVATASGTLVANMGFRASATVRLSRLTACPSLHEAVYRAAKITGQGLNPYTWSLPGCV